MKKLLLAVVAVGVVGGSFYVSRYFTSDEEAEAGFRPPDRPVAVEVAQAERHPMRETITYPGSVTANETVSITPRVTGIVRAIHVELGDFVSEGDPLVDIDAKEYTERLKQAKANLELSKAQLRRQETMFELARLDFNRVSQSGKQGITSQAELDSARAARDSAQAEMEVARADVERMQAAVEEAQLNVEDTKIVSPLSGFVQERRVGPGTLASPSSPVLTIVDTDPAEVVVYLPEREIGLAQTGRAATVTVNDGEVSFEGEVARVAPSLSMSTRTTQVVIDVPNPAGRLRPGMSTDVTLVAREDASALVVPAAALVFQNERTEVYRVEDGKAYAVPVEVGIQTEDFAQVTGGLEHGDIVVTKGQFMLDNGQQIEYAESAGPARRADS